MRRWFVLCVGLAAVGCSPSSSSSPLAVLTGPDGQRRFREWPLDAATLRGATLPTGPRTPPFPLRRRGDFQPGEELVELRNR